MSLATPQDVQTKLDLATKNLALTKISYAGMVRYHGADWTKWPITEPWYIALHNLALARTETGGLTAPQVAAAFSYKEN